MATGHWEPQLEVVNMFSAAFTRTDPKSAKKTDSLTVFFALLGSASVKGELNMLMKFNLEIFTSIKLPN